MATSWTCPRCGSWHLITLDCAMMSALAETWLGECEKRRAADIAENDAISRYWVELPRYLAAGDGDEVESC